MKERLKKIFIDLDEEWIDRFVLDVTVYQDKVIRIETLRGALYNDAVDHAAGIQGNREKTLNYLYPLLKEGKLVAGRIRRRAENTPPKSIEEVIGKEIYEDIPGTPEEIIEYIRDNWNNNPEFSEQFDCVFKLPESEWPRYH
jgi:hypothetical protein